MTQPTQKPTSSPPHVWRFFRAGGFDQVRLDKGADLGSLDQLDQKLWVALSCPTTGLEFDEKTLQYIDTDKDGRIRAPELIAAAKWATTLLKEPDGLLDPKPALPLSAINDQLPEGKKLLASANQILQGLNKKDATTISEDDTSNTVGVFAQTKFNGDGIVPADSADDDVTRALIVDVIACMGAEPDRSGKPGVSTAKLDQFMAQAEAYSEWWKQSETNSATILPLGAATGAASSALKAVKAKVDDYFARCRLAAFDVRALVALNRQESEYLTLAAKDLSITASEVSGFPLARVEPGRALPLKERLNPAWADAMATFAAATVQPLLGDLAQLDEAQWASLQAKLAPYESWNAAKPATSVEKLGCARLREILGSHGREKVAALIANDKELETEFNAIAEVDKLIRYYRNLKQLCNNFVNFRDFYERSRPATFQAGTLYLDQRSCELCLPVDNAGKHASLAGLAGTYLAYCDCVRKGTNEKTQIVAAFTDGDSDNLMVGRNGVFYDRKGRDWDATIARIVENPISLRQAFWSPYKKFVRMIEEQIAKRAAAAESESTAKLQAAATTVTTVDKAKPSEAKKVDVGTVAAIGVAVGSLGTAFGYFLKTFAEVEDWQLPLLVALVMLAISGPSMLIAYLKLRKRNLGPILDANGWAVNAKAKLNVPFGKSLTGVADTPVATQMDMGDRFAEQRSMWPRLLAILFVVWWVYAILNGQGLIYQWTDGSWGKAPKVLRLKLGADSNSKSQGTDTASDTSKP